jgi:hypothetical protein
MLGRPGHRRRGGVAAALVAAALLGCLAAGPAAATSWSPPELLGESEENAFDLALDASGAVSRDGQAVAGTLRHRAFVSHRTSLTRRWSPLASPPVVGDHYWDLRGATTDMPLAFTEDGALVAAGLVFSGPDAPAISVAAARRAPGGSWVPEGGLTSCAGAPLARCVASQPAGFGSVGPALAVNAAGRGALAWSVGPSEELGKLDRPGLFAALRSPSGDWGPGRRVGAAGAGWHGLAAGVDVAGNASVASSTQGGGPVQLLRRGAKRSGWAREVFTGATSAVDLATSDRRIVAAWAEPDAVVVRVSVAGGPWQATSIPGGARADRVLVAADGAGAVHAVWRRPAGEGAVIEHAARAPGGSWSEPAPVAAGLPLGINLSDLDIDVEAQGDLVVAWTDGAAVALRRRAAKGGWSEPTELARSVDGTTYWGVDLAGNRLGDVLLTFNGLRNGVGPGGPVVHDSMWAAIRG